MSTPGERIGEDAATRAPEIIDAIQNGITEAKGRLAVLLAIAAKVDAVVVELDREAARRVEWEQRVEEWLYEIAGHPALSIPSLSLRQFSATGPEYTEEAID